MNNLAIGFWGCFFGTTAVMLTGSALAFARSLRRIAVNAALSAFASAFFAVAFLGGLPIDDANTLARFLACVAAAVSVLLAYLLFSMLGVMRARGLRNRGELTLLCLGAAVIGTGWLLSPLGSLALSIAVAWLLGLIAFGGCVRSALNGDRLARSAMAGVFSLLIAIAGLGWIALDREHVPPQVHVASAIAATFYMAIMASVLWARYAYLIELHKVMAYGPSYDPVTRMRSHAETGEMVGLAFKNFRHAPVPLGVIVLNIANLYALEKLHGQAAVNHALYVSAGRLRRTVPAHVEMGRLGHEGFVLIMRNCKDSGQLIDLARVIESRLRRSVALNTSREAAQFETANTVWAGEIGIGALVVSNPAVLGSSAIAMGRGMSRTAISYASRIAWLDQSSGQIMELPVLAAR